MIQTILNGPGNLSFFETPRPKAKPGEAVVRVEATGICATDVHSYLGQTIHGNSFPFHPGHEIAGVVAECGEGVSGVAVGDAVVVSPLTYCGTCGACRLGRWNFCSNIRAIGLTGPGGFSDYVVSAERNLIPYHASTPARMSFAEPLATVLHALSLTSVNEGASVLIQGAGTLGLLFLKVLKRKLLCRTVDVSDLNRERLASVNENGGNPTNPDALAGQRKVYDFIIDCTGNSRAVQNAVPLLKDCGVLVIFGVCPHGDTITLSPFELYRRELRIIGSFALNNNIADAVALIENGTVVVDDLVSGVIDHSRLEDTLKKLAARELSGKFIVMPTVRKE